MVKHTPGTWQVSHQREDLILVGTDAQNVAEMIHDAVDLDEIEANARLISAAPELLAALKGFLHADPDVFADELAAARAAIAKVQGKE